MHPRSIASPSTDVPVTAATSGANVLPRAAPAQWIKCPAWDLVWILNTLWLAPLVVLLGWGHDDVRATPVDTLFFVLAVPLWFGHRISSAWLAYATPAYRPLLATQRLRFVVAPLAIAVACFAVLLAPERVLPMPLAERVVWLAILDYLLVSYHFAAQHFGLLGLYRARAGRASDAAERRLDRWFALVVGGGLVVLANALAGSIAFQDRWIDPLLGAGVSDTFARTLRDGSSILVVIVDRAGAAWRASLAAPLRAARCLRPRRLRHGALRFARGRSLRLPRALGVQPLERAMGLTSLAASGGSQAHGTQWQRLLAPINRRGWAVLLVLAVVSTLLLPVLEVEAVSDETAFADRIFGQAALWLRSSPFVPGAAGTGFRVASSITCWIVRPSVFPPPR